MWEILNYFVIYMKSAGHTVLQGPLSALTDTYCEKHWWTNSNFKNLFHVLM